MNVEPRCHVQVFLNDDSGTLSATLFASTAEKFVGYTASELMEETERNASLEDAIAKKINKKSVKCFLKDYDRSFESRFERSFTVVTLYVEEEVESAQIEENYTMVVDPPALNNKGSVLVIPETEKQPFSPSTKNVVDKKAIKVGVDEGPSVPAPSAKRGIVFGECSDTTEAVMLSEKVPSLLMQPLCLLLVRRVRSKG